MSRVYLAVVRGPAGFNKFQVVKWLLPSLASDPDFLNMFLEEARLSARLNHTNVVQINEVGFDGEHHFMAMEYLEGQSLESLVRRASRQGGLPLELHLHVLAEAAAGLHYAHEFADLDGRALNVVHRDVSPHNVFVTYQGQVKVLDFGIAKAADSSLHTRTGMLKGKVAYMAPEQLRQSRDLDRRADIFALGVMLWQAIAGRRLWQNMSDLEVFQQLNTRQIPSLREAKPDAPEALVTICDRALSFDVEGRQATAAEFGDAIEAYLASEGRRANGRELGAFISNLFAAKRAEVQALIESALNRRPDGPPPTGHFGVISQRPESINLLRPSQPYSSTEEGFSGEVLRTSQPIESALLTLPSPPPKPTFGTRSAGRPWLWPTAIALMLGTSAAAFFAVNRSVRPRPEIAPVALAPGVDPTAAEAPAPAAPAAPSASPERTHLKVEATPPNARLFVDNVPLSSNPGTATFVRDGLPHRIGAEAPGFVSEAQVIAYDKGEEIVSFQLQRERKAAAVWRPSSRPGRPSAPASPPAGQSDSPPTKPAATPKTPQLDRDSPWP